MDFDQIYLTDAEVQALRQSADHEISLEDFRRLKDYKLVDEIYSHVQGRMPVGKGRAIINDRGADYLIYLDCRERETRRERLHDWKLALFSTIGGAILSAPLWDGIRLLLRLLRGD